MKCSPTRCLASAFVALGSVMLMTNQSRATPFTAGDLAVFQADSASANNTTFTIVEISPTANNDPAVQSIPINGTAGSTALRTSGSATSTGYLALSNDRTLLTFDAHNSTTSTGNANAITARGIGTLDANTNFNLAATYTGASGNQARGATSLDNSNWYISDQGGIYTNGSTTASPAGNFRGMKSFGGTAFAMLQSSTTANIVVSTVSGPSGGTVTGLPGLTNDNTAQDFYMLSSGSNGSAYDILYVLNDTSATAGTIDKYSLVGSSWVSNGSSASTGVGGFGLAAAVDDTGADLYFTTGTGATAANKVLQVFDSAGYNSAISINFANEATVYTAPSGTDVKGIDFVPVPEPASLVLAGLSLIVLAASRRLPKRTCVNSEI